MATTKLVYEVQVDSGNSIKTLSSLENELEGINKELKQLEVGSDQFNKLAAESRRLGKEIDSVNNSISGISLDDKLRASDGAIKIAAGSLQSLVGSVALLGVESEALQEFEQRAIGAIAVGQGVKDLSEGFGQLTQVLTKLPAPTKIATAATKAFNVILRANPIGLIITAITVVVGLFITFNKRIRETIANFEPLNKVLSQAVGLFRQIGQAIGLVESEQEKLARATRELAEKRASDLEFELQLLKVRGKRTVETERELLQQRIKATEEFSDERKKAVRDLRLFEARTEQQYLEEKEKAIQQDLEAEKKRTEQLKQLAEERAQALIDITEASAITEKDILQVDIAEVNRTYDELIKTARRFGLSTVGLEEARLSKIAALNEDYNKRQEEILEKRYTDIETLNQDLESLTIQFIDDENRLREESRQMQLEDTQRQFDNLILEAQRLNLDTQNIELERLLAIETLQKRFAEEDKVRQKEIDDARIQKAREVQQTLDNLRIGNIENQFDRERELLQQQLDNELVRIQSLGASEEQITQLRQFYAEKRKVIAQNEADFEKQLSIQKLQQSVNIAEGIVGIASTLLGENAKKNKGIAIGEAIINSLLGATKALASSPPPFNFITAASVLAAGFANVRKIKQTDVESGGSGGITTPTISRPTLRDPSQFATAQTPNITQPTNQLQQQLDIQGGRGRIGGGVRTEPIRAYVVSGDVKTGLEADAKIRQRRTVGRLKPE